MYINLGFFLNILSASAKPYLRKKYIFITNFLLLYFWLKNKMRCLLSYKIIFLKIYKMSEWKFITNKDKLLSDTIENILPTTIINVRNKIKKFT